MTIERLTHAVSGDQLRKLMDSHNLTGNEGAKTVAALLGYSVSTVQGMLSRGIRRNDYMLLKLLLVGRSIKDGRHRRGKGR